MISTCIYLGEWTLNCNRGFPVYNSVKEDKSCLKKTYSEDQYLSCQNKELFKIFWIYLVQMFSKIVYISWVPKSLRKKRIKHHSCHFSNYHLLFRVLSALFSTLLKRNYVGAILNTISMYLIEHNGACKVWNLKLINFAFCSQTNYFNSYQIIPSTSTYRICDIYDKLCVYVECFLILNLSKSFDNSKLAFNVLQQW